MMGARHTPPEAGFAAARAKVEAFIATIRRPGKYPWEIIAHEKRDGFWLFTWAVRSDFWPRRKYIPTAGNFPIAVRECDGAMFFWDLLASWESFVERIRDGNLPPYGGRRE